MIAGYRACGPIRPAGAPMRLRRIRRAISVIASELSTSPRCIVALCAAWREIYGFARGCRMPCARGLLTAVAKKRNAAVLPQAIGRVMAAVCAWRIGRPKRIHVVYHAILECPICTFFGYGGLFMRNLRA